ncbi:MAG: RNA 2',3'-cyclic phosphodiesterase [Gemmatimonadota bacterium]
MRTFVALNLTPAERGRLHAALEPVRMRGLPVRWLAADGLHLTLKFLGDIEGAEVARLDHALRDVAARHSPVALRVGGLGAFPSIRRASIVWVGVQPDAPLMALQDDVELSLSRLGYTRELRLYRPHVTVGRVRAGARAPDVTRTLDHLNHESTVIIDSLDLMRSHAAGDGSRYEPLLRHRLRAAVSA